MKQGSGRNYSGASGGWKQEPIPHVVNVRAVSQIGSALGNHATSDGTELRNRAVSEKLYPDKTGFLAPRDRSVDVMKGGSQGRR